jgi:hypothetical protein
MFEPLDFKPNLSVRFVFAKLACDQVSFFTLSLYPAETMMNATGHV